MEDLTKQLEAINKTLELILQRLPAYQLPQVPTYPLPAAPQPHPFSPSWPSYPPITWGATGTSGTAFGSDCKIHAGSN